jgi:O-antigen/teichoic acid export membrane protein
VFAAPLLSLVYGERYARDHSVLLMLFAVNYVVIYVGRLLAARLRAQRRTRPIFRGHLYAGVSAVVGGWLAIHVAGVEGAAAGMVVSAAVVATVLFRASGQQGQPGELADARA